MRDELASDISDLGRDTSIVTPPGYDLKLVEATANTWQTFQAQVKMADTAIAIRILGQNLSTEVQGGSYAAAQVHKAVAAAIIRADDETSATSLRSQLIWWWSAFNFGDGRKAPWPKRDTTPPADTSALAATWDKAADALDKWLKLGAPVDKDAYARTFRLPLIEGEEWKEPEQAAPVDESDGGENTPDNEDEDEPQDGSKDAKADRRRSMALASGDDPDDATGAISGQQFVDGISAHAVQSTARAIEPDVGRLLELIDDLEVGDDWPDRLRAKLAEHYWHAEDNAAFEQLAHKATVLAELAGRVAVVEDL
jgi:phage gp29-like protein